MSRNHTHDEYIDKWLCLRWYFLFQRWNRLSRLQRSIVYALFVIAGTVLVMFYVSKVSAANVNKINHSDLAQVSII